MNNTVLLTAKGNNAVLLFIALTELYPQAVWNTPETKWWQSQPKHELRIQNLPYEEIQALRQSLDIFHWPLSTRVKVEIF